MLYEIAGIRIDQLTLLQTEPGTYRVAVHLVPQMLDEGRYVDVGDVDLLLLRHPRMGQQWAADYSTELTLGLGPEGQAPSAQALGAAVLQWVGGVQQAAAEAWVGRGPTAFIAEAD